MLFKKQINYKAVLKALPTTVFDETVRKID